uniref:Uncharacterized protein n=1 Tax=Rangifer tarandus platyrhynchus TaxID=3082113 RepID=A0ACB0EGP4_RANTA|nr:unnamed protein product [Rangifer tarandus platyrhynchus]
MRNPGGNVDKQDICLILNVSLAPARGRPAGLGALGAARRPPAPVRTRRCKRWAKRTEARFRIRTLHPGKQATLNVTGPHPEYRKSEEGGRAGSSGQKSRLLLSSRGLCPGSQSFGGLCSASSRMRRAAPRGNGIPEFRVSESASRPAAPS